MLIQPICLKNLTLQICGSWLETESFSEVLETVAVINYGDGTCDNEVTITINGGDPVTKVITPKGRR